MRRVLLLRRLGLKAAAIRRRRRLRYAIVAAIVALGGVGVAGVTALSARHSGLFVARPRASMGAQSRPSMVAAQPVLLPEGTNRFANTATHSASSRSSTSVQITSSSTGATARTDVTVNGKTTTVASNQSFNTTIVDANGRTSVRVSHNASIEGNGSQINMAASSLQYGSSE
jgi:hypothetical protein